MEGNGWNKYEVHVLETLKRVEKSLHEIHTAVEKQQAAVVKIKTDAKWYTRIFSIVSAIVVTVINTTISLSR